MKLQDRIKSFSILGNLFVAWGKADKSLLLYNDLSEIYDGFDRIIKNEVLHNPWFIEPFIRYQLFALGENLTPENLEKWVEKYLPLSKKSKKTGVIFAGNIPLVGFYDLLAVLISGHKLLAKLSSKDTNLMKALVQTLFAIDNRFKDYLFLVGDKLTDFEAIIATGSNNTARYFEYYFGKVPNIIRKNRTSVAIIDENTSDSDFDALADDIMLYFGLGCRNVSKIFVPDGFDLDKIFKAIYKYSFVLENHKYENNYIYNRSVYLLNGEKFYDNGFFIIKEALPIASPVSVLHYETYTNSGHLEKYLSSLKDSIQCVVGKVPLKDFDVVPFGNTQKPHLDDYADGIDVMEFLKNI